MNDEQGQGNVPQSTTPPYPRKVRLWVFLVLPAMNGPLPAELKFKENTVRPSEVHIPTQSVFFYDFPLWLFFYEE